MRIHSPLVPKFTRQRQKGFLPFLLGLCRHSLILAFLLLFLLFSLLFVFRSHWLQSLSEYFKYQSEEMYLSPFLEPINLTLKERPQFERFIFAGPMDSQMGNQMFRFASLWAMGQTLNRTFVGAPDERAIREMDQEIAAVFPQFHRRIYFLRKDFPANQSQQFYFVQGCCLYRDPRDLVNANANVLQLTGGPTFENHRYFHHLREQIMKLLEFSSQTIESANGLAEKLFKSYDSSHKLCVHTRRGDFGPFGQSEAGEVSYGIEFVKRHLLERPESFSILMFGDDQHFVKTVKIGNESSVHFMPDLKIPRGVELCFASLFCDSFLSTASLSSYAFWMAYLMPEDRPIFFVRKRFKIDIQIDTLKFLPPWWFPIEPDWSKE